MDDVALHPDCEPLRPLLGSWRGRGKGDYPTIDPFEYFEEATYDHVGQPFVAYRQRTRDASTGAPLHTESGYLRPAGGSRVEFVVAQPSGIVELHEGVIEPGRIELITTSVLTTPTAKPCRSVRRMLTVDATVLRYELWMEAVGQPLQQHLSAELDRVG